MTREQRQVWRMNNPEKHRLEQRLYYVRNKCKVKLRIKGTKCFYNRERNYRKEGSFSVNEWFLLCFAVGFKCLACKVGFCFEDLTPDHVVPLSKDGSNHLYNLQPMCLQCNMQKHTKTIDYREKLDTDIYVPCKSSESFERNLNFCAHV